MVLPQASRRIISGVTVSVVIGGIASFSVVSAKENKINRNVAPITCADGSVIIPYEVPSRALQIQRLKTEVFDVLVIGGGATGAGCALDATTRKLNTALVEASDFAAGTSGRSTKLIHGGIRYLQQAFTDFDYAAFKLVLEALQERAFMLNAAPYMNRPLPIMIPLYRWWEVPYMWIGAKCYDVVAAFGANQAVPRSYYISSSEALYQFPMLRKDGLKGAIVYYDGQMNDTRLNLSIALTATQNGAAIGNYVQVLNLIKNENGKISGAVVRDNLTGEEFEIKARSVVNATGPFTDAIRKMDNPSKEKICIPAAGVHVVLPDHFSPIRMGLIVPETSDGRVLFFLPWENATLAGTTDSKSDITMLPTPTSEEVEFIINEANRYLEQNVGIADVKSAWSGIRPLVTDPNHSSGDGSTSKISREHLVEVAPSNLVTIAGGKWTTYRRMAQDAIDEISQIVSNDKGDEQIGKCRTLDVGILGADRIGEVCHRKFDNITITLREKYQLDKDIAVHLVRNYGTRALQIAEIENQGYLDRKPTDHPRRLHPRYPYLEAEIVFAVRQEYAERAVDILARRMRLAYIDSGASMNVVERVIHIMSQLHNWSDKRKQEELKHCKEFLQTMH